MDNKEAIGRIKDHIQVHKIGDYPHIYLREALNMAIEALEKLTYYKELEEQGRLFLLSSLLLKIIQFSEKVVRIGTSFGVKFRKSADTM